MPESRASDGVFTSQFEVRAEIVDALHLVIGKLGAETDSRPAPALLKKAEDLLKLGYVEAAANYTRQAFEYGVRTACELKKIDITYRRDAKEYKSQEFLDRLKAWVATGGVTQLDWDAAIHRLELLKNVVMNPYSHPSAPNIPKQEVIDAIAAVNVFLALARKKKGQPSNQAGHQSPNKS